MQRVEDVVLSLLGLIGLYLGGLAAALLVGCSIAFLLMGNMHSGEQWGQATHDVAGSNTAARVTAARGTDELDVPGACQSASFQEALEKVFDCIYHQFILMWYDATEPVKDQPLYLALQEELFSAVEAIKGKTPHINESEILTGLMNILTRHLQKCKNSKDQPREKLSQTREEELAFFRTYAGELVSFLLPPSLAGSQLPTVFLTEILALKVLTPTLQTVSDPDFLNQNLIWQMDPQAAQSLSNVGCFPTAEDVCGTAQYPSAPQDGTTDDVQARAKEGGNASDERAVCKPKKKGVFRKLRNLRKKKDQCKNSVIKYCASKDDEVDGSTEESTCDSEEDGTSSEGSVSTCGTDIQSSEIKMMCGEWSNGGWKASVSSLQFSDDGRFNCTIQVTDEEHPEETLWEFEQNQESFQKILNTLRKDFPNLDDINIGAVSNEQNQVNNENMLNTFLGNLVDIITKVQNRDALFFLLPLDHSAEVESEDPSDSSQADALESDGVTRHYLHEPEASPATHSLTETTTDYGLTQRTSREGSKLTKANDQALRTAFSNLLAEAVGGSLYVCLKCSGYERVLFSKVKDMCSASHLQTSIDSLRELLWPNGEPAPPIKPRSPEEMYSDKLKAEQLLVNICPVLCFRGLWKRQSSKLFNIFQEAEENKVLIRQWLLFLLDELVPSSSLS
ncbi:uncharacterized protein [Ambystoma mexicanum]|uniref:uncharacterized protein n=1 Tax=Ambystoma mexicanum TaxID=8296 RepID=UPI0037E7A488